MRYFHSPMRKTSVIVSLPDALQTFQPAPTNVRARTTAHWTEHGLVRFISGLSELVAAALEPEARDSRL